MIDDVWGNLRFGYLFVPFFISGLFYFIFFFLVHEVVLSLQRCFSLEVKLEIVKKIIIIMESRIPFTLFLIPFEFIGYFASLCFCTENKQFLGKLSFYLVIYTFFYF